MHPLAGGTRGADELRELAGTVCTALADGARARGGAAPHGGPPAVAARMARAAGDILPRAGTGPHEALRTLVAALAEGATDPAEPHCAAHLHCPPLAVAAAADLAASALNPSMDSWDQAPAASDLEAAVTAALAALVFPDLPAPDALVTTGGTESNQIALLLARERAAGGPRMHTVCGANTHHSVRRAAWLLGLPRPVVIDTPTGVMDPTALAAALAELPGRALVVATAGTTDSGAIDPLADIAAVTARLGADLHVDAAYGGPLLFSRRGAALLDGLQSAVSVTLDLHKLGWQPVAAGLLAVPDGTALRPLAHHADYLNADDDTDAGLPDLLGRSLRTTRRPDVLKIAVTLRALGRDGMAALVDAVCDRAADLAALVEQDPRLALYARPTISTVLFRPVDASDDEVAELRRRLLYEGRAVLGRAQARGRLWLKATLLNPYTTRDDLVGLLRLVTDPPAAGRGTPSAGRSGPAGMFGPAGTETGARTDADVDPRTEGRTDGNAGTPDTGAAGAAPAPGAHPAPGTTAAPTEDPAPDTGAGPDANTGPGANTEPHTNTRPGAHTELRTNIGLGTGAGPDAHTEFRTNTGPRTSTGTGAPPASIDGRGSPAGRGKPAFPAAPFGPPDSTEGTPA